MLSHAQNFEDVMLARLFAGQDKGFYVDVGANDPSLLSVTRHFYDRGWTGINIEPIRAKWELFLVNRPRDLNLNVAVGSEPGSKQFYYVVDNDALSTLNERQAANLAEQGHTVVKSSCDVVPLDTILREHAVKTIDFLKIDAEGSEEDILRSLTLAEHRPRVLLIESICDQSTFPGWDKMDVCERLKPPQWESEIMAAGYVFAHFDGLNRFYVRSDLAHLAKRLTLPPGVFDLVTNAAVRALENIAQEKERVITELSAALRRRETDELSVALRAHLLAKDFVALLRSIAATLRARVRLKPRLGVLHQYPPRPLVQTHKFTHIHAQDAPRISLVTPSFQQGAYIERTLESVISQAYPNLEYFVEDGGSRDETVSILKKHEQRLSGWRSEPDAGQSDAINRGFGRTSGEIMGWLNSDDILLPGALHRIANAFVDRPEVDVVYGNRLLIDESGMEIGRWLLPGHDDNALLWADYIPQETLFWRRSIWQRAGGRLDSGFKFAMDWDLLVRFREAEAKFVHIAEFLGAFRVYAAQKTSAQMAELGEQEMLRIRQRTLGYIPTRQQIHRALRPFMWRHVATDLSFGVRCRSSKVIDAIGNVIRRPRNF